MPRTLREMLVAGVIALTCGGAALACGKQAPEGSPAEAQSAPSAQKPAPAAPAAPATAPAAQPGKPPALTAIPKKLPPNVTAAPAPAEAPPEPPMTRTERYLMGTIWMVGISGGEEKAAKVAANAALDEVARLESILSEWQPQSEISQVNAAAGKHPVKVGPELMACVQASLATSRWSHGAYDISWAALRDLWNFSASSKHEPPSEEAVKARLPLWNYRNIRVDEKKSTVFLVKPGMQIGLGGIAKGYALDRVSEILQKAGFNDFLVFGGGQVLVHGHRGQRNWRVGIQHPREQSYFAFVDVTDASVSTSGDYEHSYFYKDKRYHHIIDPATGFPAEKTASVTVISKSALWADAVDTAVFIMGPEKGLAALAKTPGGPVDGIMVDPTLKVSATPGAATRLVFSTHLEQDHRIGAPLAPGDPIPKLVPKP